MADDWITTTEAAELTSYHPEHIRRLIRDGAVSARKFGTIWQVSRRSLEIYVKKANEIGGKRGPKRAQRP